MGDESTVIYTALDMEKRAVELEIARLVDRADRKRVRKRRASKDVLRMVK